MGQKIILPDRETASRLIKNAWNDFREQVKEAGYEEGDIDIGLMEAFFMGGYCAGSNDMLFIIRGQMEGMNIESEIFNQGNENDNNNNDGR